MFLAIINYLIDNRLSSKQAKLSNYKERIVDITYKQTNIPPTKAKSPIIISYQFIGVISPQPIDTIVSTAQKQLITYYVK
ncbi:unnamed protein product [Paramecium sonneborni]|uniref:Uncharacterized protein n=1 Tax=Paramecium sonneborni TaxID=65129 RepID=A0A8S1PVU2_9CILI|nr:unnamed protein product [Paramecium sonneborni]